MRCFPPPANRNWWHDWASKGCLVTNFAADTAQAAP